MSCQQQFFFTRNFKSLLGLLLVALVLNVFVTIADITHSRLKYQLSLLEKKRRKSSKYFWWYKDPIWNLFSAVHASQRIKALLLTVERLSIFNGLFFNCYLAAPRPTLGHYRGGSLTQPMLITAFLLFWTEDHREPRNEVGSLRPAESPVGFKPGSFRFFYTVPFYEFQEQNPATALKHFVHLEHRYI